MSINRRKEEGEVKDDLSVSWYSESRYSHMMEIHDGISFAIISDKPFCKKHSAKYDFAMKLEYSYP